MKNVKFSILLLPLAAAVVGLAVWGPEALAQYRDQGILDQVRIQEVDTTETEGYRYSLSGNEKLYILSKCLNSQTLPESEQSAMTRTDPANLNYEELTGSYAFVENRKDSSGKEIPASAGIELCNQGIQELQKLGILPEAIRTLTESTYSAVMYSAIDVPEPRNNVLVWKISLSTKKQNADKRNRLLDAYVDADSIVSAWAEYMGLGKPREYEEVNPLSETTPYFKKFSFSGMEEGNTIVTVGFYEGINELFLKISR